MLRSREYVVVEVETTSGFRGQAWAISRGAPIDRFVGRYIADGVIGTPVDDDSDSAASLWQRIAGSMTPVVRSGSGMRALSLVDIALWDLRGQLASVPTWALLGGSPGDVDVLMVAGYVTHGDDPDAVAQEVGHFARMGHRLVKVACVADDAATGELLRACVNAGLPSRTRLVVDAAWRWPVVEPAIDAVSEWVRVAPIAWIEDPFRDTQRSELRQLRARTAGVPVGVGDESSDPDALRSLVEDLDIDVLRVDLTTIGGFTAALPLVASAARAGIAVSPHLYPETSIHLALASPNVSHVETFDRAVPGGNPLDPMHLYVRSAFPPSAVTLSPPMAPGLGATVDLAALSAFRA